MNEMVVNTANTILVLDDDMDILEEIYEALIDVGYHCITAQNSAELTILMNENKIDMFLLDLKLPDINGLQLTKQIRKNSDVGIILISGKSSEFDRVLGLEVGADDYITKPFSPRELVARVGSVLRRTKSHVVNPPLGDTPRDLVSFNDWVFNLAARHLTNPEGQEVELTTAEFDLLKTFVENNNRVLSRDHILDIISEQGWYGNDRKIDGLVSRLRKKISSSLDSHDVIKTVRGAGYMFSASTRLL